MTQNRARSEIHPKSPSVEALVLSFFPSAMNPKPWGALLVMKPKMGMRLLGLVTFCCPLRRICKPNVDQAFVSGSWKRNTFGV